MKLLYSPTSPYVRKVRVLLREKGLQVDEVKSIPNERSRQLLAANPLGKVPALLLNDGSALYDSPVICEYLDSLSPEPRMIPAGNERWPVLRAQALADGILDAAVAIVLERRRDRDEQSASAILHWQDQIVSAAMEIEYQLQVLGAGLNLGHIALGVALSYLDFRLDQIEWRQYAKGTVIDWHKGFSQRRSMLDTAPPA